MTRNIASGTGTDPRDGGENLNENITARDRGRAWARGVRVSSNMSASRPTAKGLSPRLPASPRVRLAASNERDLLLHGGPKWRAVMHSQTPDRPSIMSVHVERMRASTSPHHLNQGEPLEVADAGDEAIGYATSSMHGGVEGGARRFGSGRQ